MLQNTFIFPRFGTHLRAGRAPPRGRDSIYTLITGIREPPLKKEKHFPLVRGFSPKTPTLPWSTFAESFSKKICPNHVGLL